MADSHNPHAGKTDRAAALILQSDFGAAAAASDRRVDARRLESLPGPGPASLLAWRCVREAGLKARIEGKPFVGEPPGAARRRLPQIRRVGRRQARLGVADRLFSKAEGVGFVLAGTNLCGQLRHGVSFIEPYESVVLLGQTGVCVMAHTLAVGPVDYADVAFQSGLS